MNETSKAEWERQLRVQRVVSWRRQWTIYACLHAAALIFALLAQNWLASWFCFAVIYYCLLARWREGQAS